jgi:hypothetical protein
MDSHQHTVVGLFLLIILIRLAGSGVFQRVLAATFGTPSTTPSSTPATPGAAGHGGAVQ